MNAVEQGAIGAKRNYVSTLDRLRSLPPVFRGADLTIRFQWTSKRASHYLYLWKRKGLVASLGGHSDVYANLLIDQRPDWERALSLAMPSAVLIGLEVLRRAGWITQIPARPAVAVDGRGSIFSIEHFNVEQRDSSWFEKTRPGLAFDDEAGTLPQLTPPWALADLLASGGGWGLCGITPDDVDWSALAIDEDAQLLEAAQCFGLDVGALGSARVNSR